MEQVVFVVLHYLAEEVTIKCVNSILKKITYPAYRIIIVDNASPNGTGMLLKEYYSNQDKVKVILKKENSGFSAGNNTGYEYARNQYDADFIIAINNDTEIIQCDFVQKIINKYNKDKYYVLGPDIITLDGIHTSPIRTHAISLKEAKEWYIKRRLFGIYLHIHKLLRLPNDFFIIESYRRHSSRSLSNKKYIEQMEYVELQGACFVFSPLYITNNKMAFEELTFMYCEESLLTRRCIENGWKLIYAPDIKIKHAEKYSTEVLFDNKNYKQIEKEIKYCDNYTKSIKVLLEVLKNSKS